MCCGEHCLELDYCRHVGLFLGPIFHSVGLCVCFYANTKPLLQYILKSGIVISLALSFLLKIVWLFEIFLCFHMTF
jgi:hypothetical protein